MGTERRAIKKTEDELKAEQMFYYRLGISCQGHRIEKRISQKEMADILHVAPNTVSLLERGGRIKAYELKLYCETVGVEPNELLQYNGGKKTSRDYLIMAKVVGMTEEQKQKLLDVLEIVIPAKTGI